MLVAVAVLIAAVAIFERTLSVRPRRMLSNPLGSRVDEFRRLRLVQGGRP